jgi:hypothetical protein
MVDFRKTSQDIINLGVTIIVAVIMLIVVFDVISSILAEFIGQIPAQILSGVIGLGGLYYYAVKMKIKQNIDAWLAEA